MKRQIVLWVVLVVATWAWAVEFTITLDQNYTGAPANTARATDDYGSLMGEPLLVPTRDGQAFIGWFTTSADGGSRVLMGATGTKFTQDAVIYARWTPKTPRTINDVPACMKAALDWLKNDRHPREGVLFNNYGGYTLIFDHIFAGSGTINYAVRWESARNVTLQERRNIAIMLHEQINKWTRQLIGFEDWPFQEIPVMVVDWAVADSNQILDRQPNEKIYTDVNNNSPTDMDGIKQPSLPNDMSRFANAGKSNHQYPGGLHNRFDMYLWATAHDFGAAGHGGGWGQRINDTPIITVANAAANGNHSNAMVIAHEQGHGFGFYDYYGAVGTDRPPQTSGCSAFGSGDLKTIMHMGSGISTQSDYDNWTIRYYWNWVRTGSLENRFKMPPPPPSSSSVGASSSSSSDGGISPIRLPNIAASNQAMQIRNGINLQIKSNAMVEVYNLSGDLINMQKFGRGVYTVSFGHLPKGMYIAKVSFGSEKQILRVPVR